MNDAHVDQVEDRSSVPESGGSRSPYYFSSALVSLGDEGSSAAQAFAELRTSLLSGHFRVGRRSLAVCSATQEAGSTFVAANIATAIAQAGIKTLLVDANLSNPGLEKFILPPEDTEGFRQMFRAGGTKLDLICADVMPNLSILYAGGGGPGSSEMVAGREFKDLIDEFVRDYEFTILDTPPRNQSSDILRIAASVRYALIVARRNVSYLADIQNLIIELEGLQTHIVGSFLTDH